jgi:tRNA(Arg) A34 adenosine deaminase TadA
MSAHSRRSIVTVLAGLAAVLAGRGPAIAAPDKAHALFVNAAFAMKKYAVESGDQAFGAVVAYNGDIIGYGPSRVIANNDLMAHAEREAIRDAQGKLNRKDLSHCVLYSTSRPCPDCESAAALAGIARMYFGEDATDAGVPRDRR